MSECVEPEVYEGGPLNRNGVIYLQCKYLYRIPRIDQFYRFRENRVELTARCALLGFNRIHRMDRIEVLTQLRLLYMQRNCIQKITGLDNLTRLVLVNLAYNCIRRVDGLSILTNLKTLDLRHNCLQSVDDIVHLLQCPSLETVNLSENYLDDPDCVDEVFVKMPNLLSLRLHHNPFCQHVKPYRKTIVGKIAALLYLDDRSVSPDERRAAETWMHGGAVEEEEETVQQRMDGGVCVAAGSPATQMAVYPSRLGWVGGKRMPPRTTRCTE